MKTEQKPSHRYQRRAKKVFAEADWISSYDLAKIVEKLQVSILKQGSASVKTKEENIKFPNTATQTEIDKQAFVILTDLLTQCILSAGASR